MSEPKFDKNYAREKLKLVLRDLNAYTADEFWREINRITSGATGLPSAEALVELEAEKAKLVGALEVARDRIESERPSGEWDPLLRDIDDVLADHRKGSDTQ